MILNLEKKRSEFLNKVQSQLNLSYDEKTEFRKQVTKKYIDYAFSTEFAKNQEEEIYRELHPGLKDLHNQYQEMLALLKKDENES